MRTEKNKFDLKKFINGHNIIRKDTGWEYRSTGEMDTSARLGVQDVESKGATETFPLPSFMGDSNERTLGGLGFGEITTILAASGIGKSSVVNVETAVPLSWLVGETVMKPKTKWVNFYEDFTVLHCLKYCSSSTKEEALRSVRDESYIGTFEVEVDE